ncbi:MAG TPA: hypothetical protein DCG73_13965 [Morganella sp. (in: Bacteria)]|nr:hypothetical protein AKG16_03370 [Morganella morganii]HAE78904.1 hypothetical protein [Morganella sp. (in: enterobacteria)]
MHKHHPGILYAPQCIAVLVITAKTKPGLIQVAGSGRRGNPQNSVILFSGRTRSRNTAAGKTTGIKL